MCFQGGFVRIFRASGARVVEAEQKAGRWEASTLVKRGWEARSNTTSERGLRPGGRWKLTDGR